MMRIHKGVRAGFTLVELMVVLLILGMVAGMATMSWQKILPTQELNTDVRALAARIQGTRSDAIARNAEFKIYYDIDADRYWVETPYTVGGGFVLREQDEELRLEVMETDLHEGVSIQSVTIDGIEYLDGVVFVRFDPLAASSAHTVILYQALFERHFTIEVLALTGLIKFHEGIYRRDEPQDADFD